MSVTVMAAYPYILVCAILASVPVWSQLYSFYSSGTLGLEFHGMTCFSLLLFRSKIPPRLLFCLNKSFIYTPHKNLRYHVSRNKLRIPYLPLWRHCNYHIKTSPNLLKSPPKLHLLFMLEKHDPGLYFSTASKLYWIF